MEASEIIRRNEAIARFMGAEEMLVTKDFSDPHHIDMPWQLAGKIKQVPYHEDWSLLMPVVEKALRTSNPPIKITMLVPDAKTYGPLIDGLFEAVSDYCLSLEVK